MTSYKEPMSCCPVCRQEVIQEQRIDSAIPFTGSVFRSHDESAIYFDCPLCGKFVVTDSDRVNLKSQSPGEKWNPLHLSALLREQTVARLPTFWLRCGMDPYGPIKWSGSLAHIDVEELLRRWPRTIPDRIDRTLCNLARLSPHGGHRVPMNVSDTSLAFAETIDEGIFIKQALMDEKYLVDLPGKKDLVVSVTAKGWARFDELTRGKSAPHNSVFVAMWFGGTDQKQAMDEVFLRSIQPAIEQAGYRATRSDLSEHNDWIMDKVLGDIRLSPFVVADFTEHRNGVYLEAGFARGLGIPVINTCRADCMDKAHFDTAQLNHVVWETAEELRTKLYHRIIGTIGRGPHPLPKNSSAN